MVTVQDSVPVVLDTDIGSDVDDVLALATLFGSPELRLAGVTTVYGDTLLRARMVSRVAVVAGRSTGPVVPGRTEPRSGRPVWWPGHEGALLDGLEHEPVSTGYDAAEVLAAAPRVIAIGPLTNLAEALERPDRVVRELFLMGGRFTGGGAEHNIRCDVAAASVVFEAGLPTTVIGLEQTTRIQLGESVVERVAAAGELGQLLAAEMRQFWKFTEKDFNVPHDPAAVLMLVEPGLFEFRSGRISVVSDGPEEGVTRFVPEADGPHRIVSDLDPDAVAGRIVDRILAACRP
jgi:purine nucleosidase